MGRSGWVIRFVVGSRAAAIGLILLGTASHARSETALGRAISVLGQRGVYAENSLYACMLDAYYQGLSIQQATESCATKLLEDDEKGIDGGPFGPIGPGAESFFDPFKISASCASGDASIAGSANHGSGWGYYSWGSGEGRKGMTREESREAKESAIAEARAAHAEAQKAYAAFKKAVLAEDKARDQQADQATLDKLREEAKAATAAAAAAKKAEEDAAKKAKADPNKTDDSTHPTGEVTACEEALQGAREILRECHRTQWQNFECQQLQARTNHCPDPALIRVDPEQGYACGEKIDLEELKNAWVAQCEQLERGVDPDTNPCVPPQVDDAGRYVKTNPGLLCDDPAARYEPGNETCTVTLKMERPFGEPDLHQLIVWGLNKLGGPIIVIHDDTPPPAPGPSGPKYY